MSEMLKLELSRARAMVICICAAGAFILLFAAGTASGLLLASNTAGLQIAQAAPSQPKYESMPAEEKSGSAEAETGTTAALDQNTLQTTSADRSGNPPSLAVLASAPKVAASPAMPSPETTPNLAPAPAQHPADPATPNQAPAGLTEAAVGSLQGGHGFGLPLAVKVCSFSGKPGADNLASFLESKGYHASVVRSFGAEDRVWYVVTVGPYSEWNAAASAAARVAIIANVQPVVAQLR